MTLRRAPSLIRSLLCLQFVSVQPRKLSRLCQPAEAPQGERSLTSGQRLTERSPRLRRGSALPREGGNSGDTWGLERTSWETFSAHPGPPVARSLPHPFPGTGHVNGATSSFGGPTPRVY